MGIIVMYKNCQDQFRSKALFNYEKNHFRMFSNEKQSANNLMDKKWDERREEVSVKRA